MYGHGTQHVAFNDRTGMHIRPDITSMSQLGVVVKLVVRSTYCHPLLETGFPRRMAEDRVRAETICSPAWP